MPKWMRDSYWSMGMAICFMLGMALVVGLCVALGYAVVVAGK